MSEHFAVTARAQLAAQLLGRGLSLEEVTPVVDAPAIQAALAGGVDVGGLAFALARGLKPQPEQKPLKAAADAGVSIMGAPQPAEATKEFFDGIREEADERRAKAKPTVPSVEERLNMTPR